MSTKSLKKFQNRWNSWKIHTRYTNRKNIWTQYIDAHIELKWDKSTVGALEQIKEKIM